MGSFTIKEFKNMNALLLYENYFRNNYFYTGQDGVSTQLSAILNWVGKWTEKSKKKYEHVTLVNVKLYANFHQMCA